MRKLFAILLLWLSATCYATTRYVAQTAGIFSGGSACNGQTAITVATWNGTTLAAGDVSYLCGTVTTALSFHNGGSAGNPVSLIFDTGAKVSLPYCSASGCVGMGSLGYILIDGGTNGIIENTANGSALANKQVSYAVYGAQAHDIEIKNLHVNNIYVHSGTDNVAGAEQSYAIYIAAGHNNIKIHDNVVVDAHTGVAVWSDTTGTWGNWEVYRNTLSQNVWGVDIAGGYANGQIDGVSVHENTIFDNSHWWQADNNWHTNPIFVRAPAATSAYRNVYVYNNDIYGTLSHMTGYIFLSQYSNGPTYVFNNLMHATATSGDSFACAGEGAIAVEWDGTNNYFFYNNDIDGRTVCGISASERMSADVNVNQLTIRNNIALNILGPWFDLTTDFSSDYNDWNDLTNQSNAFVVGSPQTYYTLTDWKASGRDTHSIASNPLVNSDYTLQAGSPARSAGTNLYSVCNGQPIPGLGALCFDKAGVARPSSGAWDMGAYQFSATDIYLTQSGAGSQNGTSCANAYSAAWFNSTSPVHVSGGNTYHICGTWTGAADSTLLTVPASGSVGNPIILLFETDAVMQAPYFHGALYAQSGEAGGAIVINNVNYVIVDGGTNGIIQNTDNGQGLTYLNPSFGLYVRGTNIIVRNLTIQNILVTTGPFSASAPNDRVGATADIVLEGDTSNNISVCNNTLTHARMGVADYIGGSGAQNTDCQSNTFAPGVNIFLNDFNYHCWHMLISSSVAQSPNIYANKFLDAGHWGDPLAGDNWHTDGIFVYATAAGIQMTPYIYNNLFSGNLGTESPTGNVACTYGFGYPNSGSACSIFNNVFVNTATTSDVAAMLWMGGVAGQTLGPHVTVNNTFIDGEWTYIDSYGSTAGAAHSTFNNNIIRSVHTNGRFLYDSDAGTPYSALVVDRNVYYNPNIQSWIWNSVFSTGLAQWKTNCTGGGGSGCDANSIYGDPLLDASYKLTSTSNARSLGANLTSLCTGQMGPLCSDKPPVVGKGGALSGSSARPSSGAWDAGAYQYSATGGPAYAKEGYVWP